MQLIRAGDRGARVSDVQHRLTALGFDVPASERDGTFGDGTVTAVRAFQDARGLQVDGIVGPDTWRSLVEASWSLGDRVLYLRSPNLRGDDVRELQDRLSTLGFDVWRTDGIFGPRTTRAVREFQRNMGVIEDGIVAAETVRALNGLPRITGDTPAQLVREREQMRTGRGGLAGMRLVLDPGHGGTDGGFIGSGGDREADICFALARRVESALAAAGALVYLSRPTDQAPDDSARANLANVVDADMFLALHLGSTDPADRGAVAYYFGHERYHSETGLHLAGLLLDGIERAGIGSRGARAKTFAVLRETRMTAVLLEMGCLTDPADEKLLIDRETQGRLADAIATAVRRFAEEPVGA